MISGTIRRGIALCELIRSLIGATALLGFISLSGIAPKNSQDPDRHFRFHGQPPHPLQTKQFEPWISDERPPITVEVNVTAAWDSNQFADAFNTDSNGVVTVQLSEGG